MSTLVREKEEIPHHSPPRDYLLVCDLPQRVRALGSALRTVPEVNDDCFLAIKERMINELKEVLPAGTNLRVIEMQELADKILNQAQHIVANLDNGFIVSTCMEIAEPAHGHGRTLEVNRLCDIKGNIIGIGPRPGHPRLSAQISSIITAAAGRPLVFIEDGAFTGRTMCDIIRRFLREEATVAAVVLGFAFPESLDRLYAEIPQRKVHLIEELNQPVDWMPDHDFFPFIPNCGRVLGVKVDDSDDVYPFYGFDGVAYSIPYLNGFCPMAEWTGLKLESKQLRRLTSFFLDSAMKIFDRLAQLNESPRRREGEIRKDIMFADLVHTRTRVSIPCSVDRFSPEPPRWGVRNYLRSERDANR